MEYEETDAYATNRNVGQSVRKGTALDQIEHFANRAEGAADNIDRFIARFRGHPQSDTKAGPAPVPSGHEGQIGRLNDQLSRLEALSNALGDIG